VVVLVEQEQAGPLPLLHLQQAEGLAERAQQVVPELQILEAVAEAGVIMVPTLTVALAALEL
jgi:hypothetical protein